MSNVVVSLGGVSFKDFEVPERVAFGGAQRLAVQRLLGGGRVVNVLGADDGEIVFGGICSGDDASARARTLDETRISGSVVPLLWGDFFYNVVVAEFVADYAKPWWIPFQLKCVVTEDPLVAIASASAGAAALIAGDIAAAAGLSGQAGVSIAALATPTATGLAAAQASIGAAMAAAGGALNNGVVAVAEAADAPSGVAAINQVVASSATLAGLGGMSGYINRAATNFAGQLP